MLTDRAQAPSRLVGTIICLAACGGSGGAIDDESAGTGAAIAALPTAAAPPLPGTACDPASDGWKPVPVSLSPEDQAKQARGEPVVINYPDGYQDRAPKGVGYCVRDEHNENAGFWAVDCSTDVECPSPARCTVFGHCVVPCTSDSDCKSPQRCEPGPAEGLKMCRCIPCEVAPDM